MIIDKLLGENHYHNILTRIDGPTTPWFRGEHTATEEDQQLAYHSSFANLVFKKENGPMGELFDITLPILLTAMDKQQKQLKDLHRIRIGLVTRTPEAIVHNPHKDFHTPHRTGLYYLNQADGDTIVYNQTDKSEQYSVKEKVEPLANRWFDFDGAHYHSSTTPVATEKRIVITFNYETN